MRIIKTTLVAGLISILATFSSLAEKVKIGDPGWTGNFSRCSYIICGSYS
jgi:glycine betaine/proline transport system substrate-binding protein